MYVGNVMRRDVMTGSVMWCDVAQRGVMRCVHACDAFMYVFVHAIHVCMYISMRVCM